MIELTELKRLERAAQATLQPLAFATPAEIYAELRPFDDDYAKVFIGAAAEQARAGYQELWSAPPRGLAKRGQSEVITYATQAESFLTENEFSREFPGGYRKIGHKLDPDLVWVRFKFVVPGATSGMAYDGLVWRDGRWAWFPKPWRVIGDLSAN